MHQSFRTFFIFTLGLLAACFLPMEIVSAAPSEIKKENLIIPGKQVGLLTPGMSADEIRKVYGAKNLVITQIPGPEGSSFEGAKLFSGTDRELELIWKDGDLKKVLSDVNVIGSAWVFENGIHVGSTLVEVEKINDKPFIISGFDWDYGGYVTDFKDGKVASLSIRFNYGDKQVDPSLMGDKPIPSTDAKLRALNPTVESITVNMMGK